MPGFATVLQSTAQTSDARAQGGCLHRTEKVIGSVFFARPDQLGGRAAAIHRDPHCLRHIVHLEPAAESRA